MNEIAERTEQRPQSGEQALMQRRGCDAARELSQPNPQGRSPGSAGEAAKV
jgi:hypothetical protein